MEDGKLHLEDQLQDIILKLESEAQRLTLEKIEREKYWQEQREKQRLEREDQEQKEKEAAAFKDLMEQAQRWQQARLLREYIEAVQQKATMNDVLSEDVKEWIEWAFKKVDKLDP